MSQIYANIIDGKVINVIVGDNYENIVSMLGEENIVLVTEETGSPEINGIWNGQQFTPAPVIEELPIEEPVNDQSQN